MYFIELFHLKREVVWYGVCLFSVFNTPLMLKLILMLCICCFKGKEIVKSCLDLKIRPKFHPTESELFWLG